MKTHWKNLQDTNYIGSQDLFDKNGQAHDLNVKIKSISKRQVKGEDGKDAEVLVAEIEGRKPFVINKTNAKSLQKLFDSPFIEDWLQKDITLYVAKVRAFGETVDALRIRPKLPVIALPDLTPSHPRWNDAKTALKNKNTDLAAIKKKYVLSPENEKLLTQ